MCFEGGVALESALNGEFDLMIEKYLAVANLYKILWDLSSSITMPHFSQFACYERRFSLNLELSLQVSSLYSKPYLFTITLMQLTNQHISLKLFLIFLSEWMPQNLYA